MRMPWSKPLDMPAPEAVSASAAWVLSSVRTEPQSWTLESHYARHIGGAYIWIGNLEYVWARELQLPGFGEAVSKGEGGKPSSDNKTLHQAVMELREAKMQTALSEYVARSSGALEERKRQQQEDARQARFAAETMRLHASKLDRRAEELSK